MSLVLLDTNVASALLDREAHKLWLAYEEILLREEHAVAFQTQSELWFGAEQARWGTWRRARLRRVLRGVLVLHSDNALGEVCGMVRAHAEQAGRRLEVGDAWIAATAVQHGLPLITHDQDFAGLDYPGLEVVCRV